MVGSGVLQSPNARFETFSYSEGSVFLSSCLTHVAEALPFMRWGHEHSAGHYLDLSSAILAVTVLPLGVVLRTRERSRPRAD